MTEFNPAELEVECFGGQETSSHGRGAMGVNWTRERIRNAFMLVYDREDVDLANQQRGDTYRPAVPDAILEEIMRENVEFWRKTNILTERCVEGPSSPSPATSPQPPSSQPLLETLSP